jgi:excisionase family DNA binding protein
MNWRTNMCDHGPDRVLVDIAWVAARLGVTPRMVRRLVQERRIQHYKLGGRIRFEPADVERFIEESLRPTVDGEAMDLKAAPSRPPGLTSKRRQLRTPISQGGVEGQGTEESPGSRARGASRV